MNGPAVDKRHLTRFAESVAPYCFGDLSDEQRRSFEQHLLECDTCFNEVGRLSASIRVLESDMALKDTLVVPELAGVFGVSGRLDRPFAGHVLYVTVGSFLFALLFALPMLVEVAYAFDEYRVMSMRLAVFAFAWMMAVTIGGFWVVVRRTRESRYSLTPVLVLWLAGIGFLCLLAVFALPNARTVQASFQTWPADFGYLKSVFYAVLVGPLFFLSPFHFVVVMQNELRSGRHQTVLAVLAGDPLRVPPRGPYYVRVWVLTLGLAGLFVLNYFGITHLFENLRPAPYRDFFMGLVLTRASVWLLLTVLCIGWYVVNLNELKRECLVLKSLVLPQNR